MKGVCEHGLGQIDEILADPSLAAAWSSALAGEKKLKREGGADFLSVFLRDKGPLLRRLHAACNWLALGRLQCGEDDWLQWLLTSKRELKSSAFRVNHSLNAYNATSSNTLAALTQISNDSKEAAGDSRAAGGEDERGGGGVMLLSIQSISNWARVKEAALKLKPSNGSSSAGKWKRDSDSEGEERKKEEAERRQQRRREVGKKRKRLREKHSKGRAREEQRLASRRGQGSGSGGSGAVGAGSKRAVLPTRGVAPRKQTALPKVPPRDADNRPILPLPIRGGISIVSLGRIVTDRPLYHTKDSIYPVGFTSRRWYWSLREPSNKVLWTSRITDGGLSPLFVVTPEDDPDAGAVVSRTASGAWGDIIRKVHRLKGKGHLKVTQSGPMIFGVANSLVKQLIHEMPGAEAVRRRWEKQRREGLDADDGDADDQQAAGRGDRARPARADREAELEGDDDDDDGCSSDSGSEDSEDEDDDSLDESSSSSSSSSSGSSDASASVISVSSDSDDAAVRGRKQRERDRDRDRDRDKEKPVRERADSGGRRRSS